VRCRIPHPLHPESHGQAVGDGRLDVLACEDAVQADECNEKQIEGELALDVDSIDDDLAGADLIQLAMVGVVGVAIRAREDHTMTLCSVHFDTANAQAAPPTQIASSSLT